MSPKKTTDAIKSKEWRARQDQVKLHQKEAARLRLYRSNMSKESKKKEAERKALQRKLKKQEQNFKVAAQSNEEWIHTILLDVCNSVPKRSEKLKAERIRQAQIRASESAEAKKCRRKKILTQFPEKSSIFYRQ